MILPPATLGILGGGQLGRFFVAAAHEMGYRVWVLDPDPASPAGLIADRHLCHAYEDPLALDLLAQHCAAITTEFENVPAHSLDYLAQTRPVHPAAQAVRIVQDRISEKHFLRDAGLPHAAFAVLHQEQDISALGEGSPAIASLFPGILKVARMGYDGKGQAQVANIAETLDAFRQFNVENNAANNVANKVQHDANQQGVSCVLEQKLPLDSELSVVLARSANGDIAAFPCAENTHQQGILAYSRVPARLPFALQAEARALAEKIAVALDYVGVLAVEFFVVHGQLRVNEIAPRPHNSGHYTLDACVSSQFEQQVRTLCALPLADTRAHSAAVMVNLLGDVWYSAGQLDAPLCEPDWPQLYAVRNLKLHLYAKQHARRARKMGHFTVLDADCVTGGDAYASALAAAALLGVKPA
ncbi:MAG: 5-(carboxyamino)imidazole ribonucleotide synthase [Pseudomonadota bacterium]